MGTILLFWMGYPPDPNIDFQEWEAFRDTITGWMLLCLLLMTAVIVGLYRWAANQKKIHRPEDMFLPYTPMKWLWLACVPAVVIFIAYATNYNRLFSDASVSFMSGAVFAGVEAGVLTLLLSKVLICMPGITPAKFRYRPLWPLYREK